MSDPRDQPIAPVACARRRTPDAGLLFVVGLLSAVQRRPASFDWPCECGGPSSECTKDKDGNCG